MVEVICFVLNSLLAYPLYRYAFGANPPCTFGEPTYIDASVPDRIQIDIQKKLNTACADGVQVRKTTFLYRKMAHTYFICYSLYTQVFTPDGTLLGEFFFGISSTNLVFAPPDRLVILAEPKFFLAEITVKSAVPSMGIGKG